MPADALLTPTPELIRSLGQGFNTDLKRAFDPTVCLPGPFSQKNDTDWLKTAKCVGVNVRTIGSFWNLVPYALTLPTAQNAIHLLPVFEPGVVSSLYGPASWNLNPEFFSQALYEAENQLDTVEKQLRAVVNILHLLGKAVGMDVVPHTDRFSEMALANPQHFEWLVRSKTEILDHRADLHEWAQEQVLEFLKNMGPAVAGLSFPTDRVEFFGKNFLEETRLRLLFGEKTDYAGRLKRRKFLVNVFYQLGLETVPATMGPPYRGIEIDPNPKAQAVDEEGRVWPDFRITKPEPFSRVFGPLARLKLWESKDCNKNWELDFAQPRPETWEYFCRHYADFQREYGFDFMRGDMSHVQMRPGGVPENAERDQFYDLLGSLKNWVRASGQPSFGYFAESFLAPPGEMAYGDECDHLEASHADTTLGDLQSEPIGTQAFMKSFAQYRQWLETRKFAPNFTLMTADKDDPRFDKFYLDGNEARYFLGLFLTDMPAYMGLGFECRDPHPQPAPNEHYTKLYVFYLPDGEKGTRGPYQWGRNWRLYREIVRMKEFSEKIGAEIAGRKVEWLLPPDATGKRKTLAWTLAGLPKYVFVVNLDTKKNADKMKIPLPKGWSAETTQPVFTPEFVFPFAVRDGVLHLEGLKKGSCHVFECGE